ncbi:MAG: hypothetical protein GY926_08215 [bacterium]|nr:hypothetical protein [bacterium]
MMDEAGLDGYDRLAVNGHLVAALEASEKLCSTIGPNLPVVTDLLEHLWSWVSVDESSFSLWHDFDSPLLQFALGGDLPVDLAEFCDESGTDVSVLRSWFSSLVEIVYAHLFAAVIQQEVIEASSAVLEIAESFGVRIHPAERYRLFGSVDDRGGWGPRIGAAELAEWRSAPPGE